MVYNSLKLAVSNFPLNFIILHKNAWGWELLWTVSYALLFKNARLRIPSMPFWPPSPANLSPWLIRVQIWHQKSSRPSAFLGSKEKPLDQILGFLSFQLFTFANLLYSWIMQTRSSIISSLVRTFLTLHHKQDYSRMTITTVSYYSEHHVNSVKRGDVNYTKYIEINKKEGKMSWGNETKRTSNLPKTLNCITLQRYWL